MKTYALIVLGIICYLFMSCKKEGPEASFTTKNDTYELKKSIQFQNESKNGLTYYWNFGDGEFSELKNPGHTYSEIGEYIVTLQVTGAKKTTPVEFSKKILITSTGEQNDLIFANTHWVADSITDLYYNCSNQANDNSSNNVNYELIFKDDNTVLMLQNAIGNICEYDILDNDKIGFYENNQYYRVWQYQKTDDRLQITLNRVEQCPWATSNPSYLNGQETTWYFYKK
ncbi:MAG: PKD domain-containing protein [Crocinitomicaceae bacterium]